MGKAGNLQCVVTRLHPDRSRPEPSQALRP